MTPAAAAFFTALGFEQVERAQLPDALAASSQLRGACPDSARAWRRR
jgi:N-acetylglutamate synthase-like GNAT family acetyltransferase